MTQSHPIHPTQTNVFRSANSATDGWSLGYPTTSGSHIPYFRIRVIPLQYKLSTSAYLNSVVFVSLFQKLNRNIAKTVKCVCLL